jgi:hypothetical protein
MHLCFWYQNCLNDTKTYVKGLYCASECVCHVEDFLYIVQSSEITIF